MKQYSRRTNLEISNLSEKENEDLKEVLTKIQQVSNSDFVADIAIAHRIPTYNKDKPKPIIVQFKSKESRDKNLKILKA